MRSKLRPWYRAMLAASIAAATPFFAACDEDDGSDGREAAPAGTPAHAQDVAPAARHPRSSNDARTVRRPPVLGGEPVDRNVTEDVAAGDAATVEAARRRYGADLDRAPAPVLLPPADSPYFGGTLIVRPAFWAYSVAVEPVTVSIQASTRARIHTPLRPKSPDDRIRGVPAWITTNEGIVSIAWIERGIAYTLEVECGDPRKEACRDDALARSIAASLVPVGGKGVTP